MSEVECLMVVINTHLSIYNEKYNLLVKRILMVYVSCFIYYDEIITKN